MKNLSTEFPVKKGIVKAVEDVSFDVDAGEILAIVGESGSGKSVTSLSVMGLLAEPGHVAGGSMEFEGKDLVHLSLIHISNRPRVSEGQLAGSTATKRVSGFSPRSLSHMNGAMRPPRLDPPPAQPITTSG